MLGFPFLSNTHVFLCAILPVCQLMYPFSFYFLDFLMFLFVLISTLVLFAATIWLSLLFFAYIWYIYIYIYIYKSLYILNQCNLFFTLMYLPNLFTRAEYDTMSLFQKISTSFNLKFPTPEPAQSEYTDCISVER